MGRGGLVLPAYRPGMVPRVALTPRMGSRGRGQLMNDLMGECPSLLDDLVFYPIWQGSQCVDMISGTVLTNVNAVPGTDLSPNGEIAGRYIAASSQYLYTSLPSAKISPAEPGTVAAWFNFDDLSAARMILTSSGIGIREGYALYYTFGGGGVKFVVLGTAGEYNAIARMPKVNTWELAWGVKDISALKVGVAVGSDSLTVGSTPLVLSDLNASIDATRIGSWIYNSIMTSGSIGATPIWKRVLSDQERSAFYNNGLGLRYPFRR